MDSAKGSGFIYFLDNLFEELTKARLDRNVIGWYDVLCAIHLNLSTEMDEKLMGKSDGCKGVVSKMIGEKNIKDDDELIIIEAGLEECLCEWEIMLRKLRKDANLQQTIKLIRRKYS